MMNDQDKRKFYLLEALHKGCSNGDAYVMDDMLFPLCKEMNKPLTAKVSMRTCPKQFIRALCTAKAVEFTTTVHGGTRKAPLKT